MSVKESVVKPNITEFHLGQQIGEGNFSRIVVATHIATKETFALKIIAKQKIRRLRVRHHNIYNEINMEKHALSKLRHPNIIRLYHTFQDESHLYFLLELKSGGELLSKLFHLDSQIGIPESSARFYLIDIVNALEYIHANKIVHRDLKPENLVIDTERGGHLCLIDFGTAKDMANASLNGPNFVGTPEYMSPETVENKSVTYTSDIWALGCIMYQLLTGETPFTTGSAYLTFLKVIDAHIQLPEFLSDEAKDLIIKLLQKDPSKRIALKEIKEHPFFALADFGLDVKTSCPISNDSDAKLLQMIAKLKILEETKSKHSSMYTSKDPLQHDVETLGPNEKSLLMHLLKRKNLLHLPGIYPRFFESFSRGRCLYACNKTYIGYTHDKQNAWQKDFKFLMVVLPAPKNDASFADLEKSSWDVIKSEFSSAISRINELDPVFVFFYGAWLQSYSRYNVKTPVTSFQNIINEIKHSTQLAFVPNPECVSTESNLEDYRNSFGSDYYSFWYGGSKFIVINSALYLEQDKFSQVIREQEAWIQKEVENGKLCACQMYIFAYHTFMCESASNDSVQLDQLPTSVCNLLRCCLGIVIRFILCTHTTQSSVTLMKPDEANANENENVGRRTEVVACHVPDRHIWSIVSVSVTQEEAIIMNHDLCVTSAR